MLVHFPPTIQWKLTSASTLCRLAARPFWQAFEGSRRKCEGFNKSVHRRSHHQADGPSRSVSSASSLFRVYIPFTCFFAISSIWPACICCCCASAYSYRVSRRARNTMVKCTRVKLRRNCLCPRASIRCPFATSNHRNPVRYLADFMASAHSAAAPPPHTIDQPYDASYLGRCV
jgi:hypothetical protein